MTRRSKAKVNIPLCLAGVLLCLTMISTQFTSGLYARYVATGAGSDSARVIRFGDLTLTETGDFAEGNTGYIIPGVNLIKKAVVDFEGSESATYVFVEVIPTGWTVNDNRFAIQDGGKDLLSWAVADGWKPVKDTTYVYYRELEPNVPLTADIVAENGEIIVSPAITKSDLAAMGSISINLRAAVVQAGGFDTPEAAWASVSAH